MARRIRGNSEEPRPIRPPAKTPEDREQQLISAAFDNAEKQILNGTAPAQVVTHFLKLGSTRERLEQERLKRENILLAAKAEAMETSKRLEAIYAEAISALRSYRGEPIPIPAEVVDEDDY